MTLFEGGLNVQEGVRKPELFASYVSRGVVFASFFF